MRRDLFIGAAGALVATVLMGAVSLTLRNDGILFPDGSLQTTAAQAGSYYLTETSHDGNEALTACDSGFHMASLWEILDPSSRKYDTTRGLTVSDSGSGLPTIIPGWVRTGAGNVPGTTETSGSSNCEDWTSADNTHFGTRVHTPNIWTGEVTHPRIAPWIGAAVACNNTLFVWCVED